MNPQPRRYERPALTIELQALNPRTLRGIAAPVKGVRPARSGSGMEHSRAVAHSCHGCDSKGRSGHDHAKGNRRTGTCADAGSRVARAGRQHLALLDRTRIAAPVVLPRPWQVTQARIDLRPGGEFFTLMRGPDGERVPNHGVFLEIQPQRRLVTTDAFRAGWIPGDQAFMVADIRFDPTPEGDTHYLARAMHWTDDARRQHEEMGFHPGWNAAADQLEALARRL